MQGFMETVVQWSDNINAFVWGVPTLILLLGTGAYLSGRLGFIQFRKFGYTMKETVGKAFKKSEAKEGTLTPFQAMTTALAGTVGTGNIAGVAGAIAIGGPGAIFWMWVAAIFGMCTKFSEIVLAVRYRKKNDQGDFIGGPMYYIQRGLGKRWSWLGGLFAAFAAIAALGTGNMTQINTISTSIGSIFTAFDPNVSDSTLKIVYFIVGLVGTVLAAFVLFGGMQRIGRLTEKLVPFMAVVYVVCCLTVVITHASQIIPTFFSIFHGAFDAPAVGGGLAGVTIQQVIKAGFGRGIFSNEAGLGTAPIAHAAANVYHPVKQGFYGIFEVFADTIVICTLTALAILSSGCAEDFFGSTAGTNLTILAFGTAFGSKAASIIISLCIALFAFSTLLGWALYGSRCFEYLFGTKSIKIYQIIYLVFIMIGANVSLSLVWQIADSTNALMAIPNLIGVLALSPEVIRLTREYFSGDELPYYGDEADKIQGIRHPKAEVKEDEDIAL